MDQTQIIFREEQRFRQWWLVLLFVGLNGLFATGVYIQIIKEQPFGNNPMSNGALIFTGIIVFLFTLFFVIVRLQTFITKDVIYVRFHPLFIKMKKIEFKDISKAYIRTYRPVLEYGGWGIRGGAYNVSGNVGLQLEFKNGDKLLIGTQQPDALRSALEKTELPIANS